MDGYFISISIKGPHEKFKSTNLSLVLFTSLFVCSSINVIFYNNSYFASSATDAGFLLAWVHLQMSRVLPDLKYTTCTYVYQKG